MQKTISEFSGKNDRTLLFAYKQLSNLLSVHSYTESIQKLTNLVLRDVAQRLL